MNPIPPVENTEPVESPALPELRIVPPLADEGSADEAQAAADKELASDPGPLLEALAGGPIEMAVPRTASEAFHFLSVRAAEKTIEEAKREGGAAAAQMWGNLSEVYKGLSAFSAQLPEAKARHLKWSYLIMLEAIPQAEIELGQLLRWLEKVPACADDKAAPAAFLWFHLGQCSFIHGQSLPRPQRTAQGWTCEHNGLTRVLSNEESYGLQQQRHFWSQQYYDRCMQTAGILLRKLSGIDVKFDPNKNPLEVVCVKCQATVRAGSSHDCPAESAAPTDGVPPMRAFTRPEAPAEPSPAAFDDAPAAEAAETVRGWPEAPPTQSEIETAEKRVEDLRNRAQGQDGSDEINDLLKDAQEELKDMMTLANGGHVPSKLPEDLGHYWDPDTHRCPCGAQERELYEGNRKRCPLSYGEATAAQPAEATAEVPDSKETAAAAAPAGDGTAAATEAPSPVEAIEAAFATAIVPADPDVPTMIGNKVPAPAAVPSGTDEEPTAFATAPRED